LGGRLCIVSLSAGGERTECAKSGHGAGTPVAGVPAMTDDSPVHLEVRSPLQFDRVQLLLRVALAVGLGWFGITAGWLSCLLFGTLPIIAAVAISSLGALGFQRDFVPRLWRVLRWLLQLSAYMMLLIDRFPTGENDAVHIDVRCEGTPGVGSALARLITTIPSALALAILGCVASFLWLIAAGLVLLGGPMPPWILAFQRGMLRWQARLIAYHASLVDEYPPFHFETDVDDNHSAPLAASGTP
jgi:hypothetical protein